MRKCFPPHNRFFLKLRPGQVLGFLLFVVSLIFLLFVGWELLWFNKTFLDQTPPKFEVSNWLFFIVGYSAIAGWIISSLVTIRNSIKQHTINTILQTRLSVHYMSHAEILNKKFFRSVSAELPEAQNIDYWKKEDLAKEFESLTYILNFFEFISAGIRYGDLDENLMQGTMRGILIRLYQISHVLISEFRATDTRRFEHIVALHNRWK